MEYKKELEKALSELRKGKERKFDQTVDFIINLRKFDMKKNQSSILVNIPFMIREKKICGFFEIKNESVDTITPKDFKKYSDKKELKKLVKKYDFFIAQASLMPKVATTFGRALGPAGKMPSPQLGIMKDMNEKEINEIREKVNKSIKIRIKEPSLKLAIGKERMKDEEILKNIAAVYNEVLKFLPQGKENIKNIELKFTMTKPYKINVN